MTRRILALAAVAALVLAAPAEARIVPQQGIAGVTLGMTKAKVRAKLGSPATVRSGKNDFGPYQVFVYSRVRVTFQSGNPATAVETRSALEQTASGIGVGSTKAAVKASVFGVKCEAFHCFVGSFRPGKRVTDFFLSKGRVSRVVVGFVLD